jgi:hypothetical protein
VEQLKVRRKEEREDGQVERQKRRDEEGEERTDLH